MDTILCSIFSGGYCTLVEPNKTGIAEMQNLFSAYDIPEDKYTIRAATIEETDIQEQYDIVIAEGFLHSIDNSEEIIRRLSGYVREGGVIVITCMDVFSMFVEQMKRLVCHVLIKDIHEYEAQVKWCADFFAGQMKNAKGMSRSVEDWVRDDMLNPAFNNEKILSMDKAFEIFENDFSLLGSSQRIFTDYSWYKDLEYDEKAELLHQYKLKRHNFLFTGLEETILSEEDSKFLEQRISVIRQYAREYEVKSADVYLNKVEESLKEIRPTMQKINQVCAEFVDEVIEILCGLKTGQAMGFERYKTFYAAVGRTQQYLSMVKKVTKMT